MAHDPATDGQRQEAVEAAEAVARALDRYVAALGPVAHELPNGRAITDAARTWAAMFADQVESWRHHQAAKSTN